MSDTQVRTEGPVTALSDAELVSRAASDPDVAFGELYRRHAQAAWRLAQAVAGNSHDAADAVSEAFTRVMKSVSEGRLRDTSQFRGYLLTATRNAALDGHRRGGRTQATNELDHIVASGREPAERMEGGEDAALVATAFRNLPERWRAVLWLTEVEGVPVREAADQLGLSANGAAQLAVRARAGLRERYLQAHLRTEVDDGCRFSVDRLGAYVAGALSPRDLAKVDQHLTACEDCQARKEELEDLGPALRRVALPLPLVLGAAAAERWKGTLIASTGGSGGAAAAAGAATAGSSWQLPLSLRMPAWAEKGLAGTAAAVFTIGAMSAAINGSVGVPDVTAAPSPPPEVTFVDEPPAADLPETSEAVQLIGSSSPSALDLDPSGGVAATGLPTDTTPSAPPAGEPGDPGDPGPEPAPEHEPVPAEPAPAPAPESSDPPALETPEVPEPLDEPAGDDVSVEATVGGRYDDDSGAVSVGTDCTGITLNDVSAGCEVEAPEDDGLVVEVEAEPLLPRTSTGGLL